MFEYAEPTSRIAALPLIGNLLPRRIEAFSLQSFPFVERDGERFKFTFKQTLQFW